MVQLRLFFLTFLTGFVGSVAALPASEPRRVDNAGPFPRVAVRSPQDSSSPRFVPRGQQKHDSHDDNDTNSFKNETQHHESTQKKKKPTLSTNNNQPIARGGNTKKYTLIDRFDGEHFFDGFEFWPHPDPTHGNVEFVDHDEAFQTGLADIKNGVAIMRVDNKNWIPEGGNRKSVRVHSKKSYGQSLFIMDVKSMPYGCGTWPAMWMNGPEWPKGGEVDILEGVHDQTDGNRYTLHTSPGCHLDASLSSANIKPASKPVSNAFFTGRVLATDCNAKINDNTGCGIQDPAPESYGKALNDAGGAVFATLIAPDGVSIWRFGRREIPSDISSLNPNPNNWGPPKARWGSSSCPSEDFFTDQTIIFDITLCGDWAGATYGQSSCPGTCAQRVMDPKNFDNAKWEVNSVAIYK